VVALEPTRKPAEGALERRGFPRRPVFAKSSRGEPEPEAAPLRAPRRFPDRLLEEKRL